MRLLKQRRRETGEVAPRVQRHGRRPIVRSWRTSPATAWEHPLVEWTRTATSYCSIVLDCDSRESQELACAVEAGYGDLPRPNVAAQRATSGHLHLGWNLRTPVHRAASRPRPLAALCRHTKHPLNTPAYYD